MKKTHRRQRTVLEKILKVFREAQRPLLLAELAEVLGERRAKRQNLAERLQELIEDGELVALEGGRYGLTAAMNLMVGTGFGPSRRLCLRHPGECGRSRGCLCQPG